MRGLLKRFTGRAAPKSFVGYIYTIRFTYTFGNGRYGNQQDSGAKASIFVRCKCPEDGVERALMIARSLRPNTTHIEIVRLREAFACGVPSNLQEGPLGRVRHFGANRYGSDGHWGLWGP